MLSFWQRPSSIMLMMTVELDLLFAAQRTSFPVAAHVAMPAHVIMIMTAVTTIMENAGIRIHTGTVTTRINTQFRLISNI